MIVLDENIVDGQRLLLEGWNVTARQVGLDVGRKGLQRILNALGPERL